MVFKLAMTTSVLADFRGIKFESNLLFLKKKMILPCEHQGALRVEKIIQLKGITIFI